MKIKRPESKQPIPKDAERVFKGVIFDVYRWEQKLFDGSCRVFEKLERPDTVVVIGVTEDKKIMLVETVQPGKKSYFGNAAGQVDRDEDLLMAAKREFLEETGYKSRDLKLWFAYQPASKIDWAIYFFVARSCKKVAEPLEDPGERVRLKLVTLEELVELVLEEKFDSPEVSMEILRACLDEDRMKRLKDLLLG